MNDGAAVELRRVSKHYAAVAAVRELSLTVHRGEFFSLLGPSGCGKTTTLRLLAGFETPDDDGGEVRIGNEVVNARAPYERNLGMVFQNYALFPHLSVERNVAFGLERRRVAGPEASRRVHEALDLVRLDPATYARRMPAQLSGGQRQRVALARALVLQPGILLLDEPLGAIDLKLRKAMQLELRDLNRRLGITFVYVTHDQEEALTMSDRIAVMNQGHIAQLGTPAEIYEHPRTRFVAEFIGESNFFGNVAVRPELVDLHAPGEVPAGRRARSGVVREIIFLGETIHVIVRAGDADVRAAVRNAGQLANPLRWKAGDAVDVSWRPESEQLLEPE